MDKGTVVFVRCSLARGGFPDERFFTISGDAQGQGRLIGVAPAKYCYTLDRTPLGSKPDPGSRIDGYLAGIVVRRDEGDTVRVHLPDGDVYDLLKDNVESAKPESNQYVPV